MQLLENSVIVFCFQDCFDLILLFSDREKLLKFDGEGWKFAKYLKSLEQFFEQWKVSTIFETE